jgi:hypothetical protein
MMAGTFVAIDADVYGQEEEEESPSPSTSPSPQTGQTTEFQDTFNLENCSFDSHGSNTYFILEPGHQSILQAQEKEEEGDEVDENIEVIITVLNNTKVVDGIETRVVEERESEDGELVEISRNYFAICKPTNDIFYFGEDVDDYEDGQIVSHEGAWLAGENNARVGLYMPGNVQVGMKYYQEFARGIAEDRAEIISLNEVLGVPAGNFTEVLKVEETNPLEPDVREDKFYAPGIGIIQDELEKLVKYTLP